MRLLIIPLFYLIVSVANAQHPSAAFTIPSSACRGETVDLSNQSTNSSRYEWDFCQGDLSLTPTPAPLVSLGGGITTGIDIVFDGTNWFGFVTNQQTNTIIRLDFGSNLKSAPSVTNLGNISGVLIAPADIKIVQENGNWYGFVYGMGANAVFRIDFGDALTNTTASPTPISAEVVVNTPGSSNSGFDVIHDGTNWFIVYAQSPSINIVRLADVEAIPPPADIISGVVNTFGASLGDLTLQKNGDDYYGYIVAYGNQTIQRLKFGSNLFSTPVIDDISTSMPTGARPYGIDSGIDNGNYYLLIATLEGNVYRINLGGDLSQTPVSSSNLVLSGLVNNIKLCMVKNLSSWVSFTTDFNTSQLFRMDFPAPASCSASSVSSTLQQPSYHYTVAGNYQVTLRSFNGGNYDEIHKTITIGSAIAPDIDLDITNVCLSSPISFSATSSSSEITSYTWDFGDGNNNTGPTQATEHTYDAAGVFNVSLNIIDQALCKNKVVKQLTVYDPPVPAFQSPSGVICTNNAPLFVNQTPDSFDGHLTYEWYVDDELVGDDRDLQYEFLTTGVKAIKLVTSLPGCSTETNQNTSFVYSGPDVDFTFQTKCEAETIQFSSSITGETSSINWDFNGESSSTDPNPQKAFLNPGQFPVELSVTNLEGCQTTIEKTVIVYSKPQPDFEIDAPPSSCANAITQFYDETPPLNDGEVILYHWTFGDPDGNIASSKNPTMEYKSAGDYLVSLTVTTDQGCTNTFQKTIPIAPSPTAVISNTATCVGVPATFTAVGTGIKSYYWEMGVSFYTASSVQHTFATPGPRTVFVTVEGLNNCLTTYEKAIDVPVRLTPDFSVTRNCTGVDAIFTDVTSGADPVVERLWNFHGLGTNDQVSAVFNFDSPGDKNVTLDIVTEKGCAYTASRIITVIDPPVAAFSSDPETGAMPLDVQFTNESTGATSYQWIFETANGQVITTVESPSFAFEDLGDFDVKLIATNVAGCQDEELKTITVLTPLPDIDLRLISFSENPDGTYKVIITAHNKGNTVVRNLPVDVNISGNFSLRETIVGPILPNAMYNLVLDYGIHPQDDLEYLCATAELTGDMVPEGNRICRDFESTVSIVPAYPNPANDLLKVEWIAVGDEVVKITLIDSFGKKIRSTQTSSVQGLNQLQWDVNDLNDGIFILTIEATSPDGLTARKTQRILIVNQN